MLAIERVWVYFFSIFEETFDAVYGSYYNYYCKAIRQKKQSARTEPIRSFPKIPISDYVVRFCPWLKQYSVLLPFFGVMS